MLNYLKNVLRAATAALLCITAAFSVFRTAPPPRALAEDSASLSANQRILTVIMYHSILKSATSPYIVTPDVLENDIMELKNRGFETVFPSEVIEFCENGGALPQKPIMITFDDGYYNNMYYAAPVLKKHGCKALINIIGKYSEDFSLSRDHSQPAYSHLTFAQIRDMAESGTFEIGNHTYDMHKHSPRYGILQARGEPDGIYREKLLADTGKLQTMLTEKSKVSPACFAYPFGKYSSVAEAALLESGFKMLLTCYEKNNIITAGCPECIHRVCRFNRAARFTTKAFFDRLDPSAGRKPL